MSFKRGGSLHKKLFSSSGTRKYKSKKTKNSKMIDFDSVNSSLKGSFDIILKKKL